ncbi:MAG: hypothetical protein CM15mP12_2290 [Gammaproteobacteria bacterium]|nr:MAG: hypothetical protein CM15mP12_2290 [Gammaproteobacteria bacterium]
MAQKFSNNIIIEEAYEDAEYTVAILDNKPLAPLEIRLTFQMDIMITRQNISLQKLGRQLFQIQD